MNKNEDSTEVVNQLLNKQPQTTQPQTLIHGKFTCYLTLCVLVACLGSGLELGWNFGLFNSPSAVIKQFYSDVYYSRHNETISETYLNTLWSLTNGVILIGGVCGGLFSGLMSDYLGRKKAIIFVNIIVVVATFLFVISKYIKSYETVILARFVSGIVIGLLSGVVPIYLNEISPINLRGSIGTIQQVISVFGKLSANIAGLSQLLGTEKLWPILTGLLILPSFIHIGLFFLVDSPKYLFTYESKDAAHLALIKLRNNDKKLIENEMKHLSFEMNRNERLKELEKNIEWKQFFREKHLRKALLITILIQAGQNLTGIDAFVFYSTDIFEKAGLTGQWPNYATIILSAVQLLMTIVSMLIIEKTGRKVLMVIGLSGISFFSFSLALFRVIGQKYPEEKWLNYMTVLCAVFYMISWSIGPSSIPWLITAELFASNSRGKATSVAMFINWFTAFVVAISFPFIEEAINSYSFIVFGVFTAFSALFVQIYVPETKNKSIEQIIRKFLS